MLQLNRAVSGSLNPMRNLDARARALSLAIGSTDGSLKNHAKSVSELVRNNTILSSELNRTKATLKGLGTEYKFATGTSNEFKTAAIRDLKAYEKALRGVRVGALTEDLKNLSQEQKRLGKDAQFVGRSLIIGLTTPIMLFGRYGLQALVGVDREFIRLNKVLESVAPNLDDAAKKMGIDLSNATDKQNQQLQKMVANYEKLDKKLTATSTKFGLSKNITVGLAGEFAELGIQSTDAIAKITELTAATEKIGNMDIGSSKDLVQALYFQAQRALQQSGEGSRMSSIERETRAIEAATAQLRLFNSVENVTALTLRDLGDAFPEVAAAATSFGLSMTEAGALLAPMKAAGFEVGASANSIKVSLQRIVAPTKQNAEMLKALEKQYQVSFSGIKGTGLDAIQLLIDGFNELRNSTAGQEGAMEFFAKLFGVRQGPRMEVAIAQMAEFDAILKNDVIPSTTSAEKRLQGFANTAIIAGNKTAGTNLPLVKSFKDIGIIARIASSNIAEGQQKTIEGFGVVGRKEVLEARKVRDALSKEILTAQRSGGEDLIGQVASEAGRAMFVQLAGGANAAEVAQRELKASLGSLDVQISILRNNFKMFAADLIVRMKPAIEKISEVSTRLYNAWKELTPQTRRLITTLTIGFAGVVAAIGPLIFVFGQFRLAVGSVGKVIFGFLPGLKTMTIDMLASRSAMLNLKNPLVSIGDTVYNTNGKFATFIATIASGDGPLANFATKIGRTTGILKESTTAQMSVTRSLLKYNREQTAAVAGAVPGVGAISRTPIEPLRRLKRTSGGIVDALDPTARVSRAARKAFAEEEFSMEQGGLRRGGTTGSRFNLREQSGLLRNRTVGFRSISAEDVGSAINLRQQAFEDSGITRTSPAGSLGGGILKRRGREISEEKALTIARGGVKGRIVESLDNIGAGASAARSAVTGAITGAPAAATAKYTAALAAAKEAQKNLRIETLAFTGEGPTQFARMKAGVLGFAKSFGVVNNAIKLTKLTLIASGIGIIILAVGVAVMLVMKNMDKFKQAGAGGLKVVKEAFDIVKNAAMELIRPILDLFGSFGDGSQGAEGAVSGIGNAFNALAGVLKFVANMFSWLVTTIIQPYMYVIVNIVKFVISLFTGNWMDALKSLGAAFGGAFALIGKIILNIMALIVKQVINLIFELPSAFMKAWAWGVERATDLFFGFVEFIIGQVKRIPVLGRFLGAAGNASLSVLKTARNAYVGTVKAVAGAVNTAGDFLKRGIDKGVQNATNAMDKLGKGGVKQSKGKISIGGKGKGDTAEVDAEPLQEEIANATGEGLEEGADAGGKALANKIKGYLSDLKKEVQSDIADRIKTTIDNVVTALKEGLKSQKEASLKIYDDQLKKIDETVKAEEKLTKTKEYENKKRELEEQRALNRLNNQRNYNLAVYEGRIDDARQIAMEGQKSEQDDSDKIKDLETSRSKELADQRREDLISSIKDARESSSKYFDEMIETFTNAAKKITEFPPTTAEKFNEQLELLKTAANTGANAIGTSFEEGFTGVLGNLGVNATGPLTSALQTITDTIVANNPFGETGVWQKTIDASLDGLKAKYEGMTDTLNMVIDENSSRFKALFEVYKSYKLLVDTDASGATGGGLGGPVGGLAGGGGGAEQVGKGGVVSGRAMAQVVMGNYRGSNGQSVLKYLENAFNMVKEMKSSENSLTIFANFLQKYPTLSSASNKATLAVVRSLYMRGATPQGYNGYKLRQIGGPIPYGDGGPTQGPVQQGIPAILHGGEYVVRNSAVNKYGWGMMQQINQGTYKPKPFANGGRVRLAKRADPKEIQAKKEFNWQQNNGGFTQSYWDKVGKAETGLNLEHKSQTGSFVGGYGMTNANWLDYGGADFAPSADKASKTQQLVINNRKAVFGYINKINRNPSMPRGATQLMFPTGTGGWTTIGEDKKVNEPFNIEGSFVSSAARQKYVDSRNKNYFRGTGIPGEKGYRPPHERRIQMYGQNLLRVPKADAVRNSQNNPIEFLNDLILKGQYPSTESANRFNGGIIPEYKVGGLVDRSKLNPFSDLNYKPKNQLKKKKQSGFWNVMDKIQGGVNSTMNFSAGLLNYSGKQIKAMTYDPLVRLQEATFNPLMQILRVPGSKNLKIATPKEAAYSGFETGLSAFGGPAMASLLGKISTIGIKGGMGPIERAVAGASGKATSMTSNFGINEAFAGTRDAKIAAIAKSKAMENTVRFNVAKSKLARISANLRDTGFAPEYLPVPKGGYRRPSLGGGRRGYDTMQPALDEIASIKKAMRLQGTEPTPVDVFNPLNFSSLQNNKLNVLEQYLKDANEIGSLTGNVPKMSDFGISDASIIKGTVQRNAGANYRARSSSRYGTPDPYFEKRFERLALRNTLSVGRFMPSRANTDAFDALNRLPFHESIRMSNPQSFRDFQQSYDFFTPFARSREDRIAAARAIKDAADFKKAITENIKTNIGASKLVRDARQRALVKTEGLDKTKIMANIKQASSRVKGINLESLKKEELMILLEKNNFGGEHINLQSVRPVESYKGFGVDAIEKTFTVETHIGKVAGHPINLSHGQPILEIDYMTAKDSLLGQMDAIKTLFALYENIMKPRGIKYIDPGSTSKYSRNLIARLQERMKFIDPDIAFINASDGMPYDMGGSLNDIDFSPVPRIRRIGFSGSKNMDELIEAIVGTRSDLYATMNQRLQINQSMRKAIGPDAGKFNGGIIPYSQGGPTFGPAQQGIPAMLHGGEFVVRNSAVEKYGWGMMDQINKGSYQPKEYKIGGLVKGSSGNKPISWEDQRIAFMAQEEMKKKKQGIFGKIKSTVARPFVGIKNFAKDQLMKNMYGAQTGSGITGSAMLLDRATNPNIERVTPGISALNMQSVRGGLSAAKTMTEMGAPVSGSFFSLQGALNPNKNAKSRITSGAAAGLSLLGPTTIFASNYGYMGSAYKSLPKAGSLVDEGLSNLKNPEFLKAMEDRIRFNVEQSRLAREAAKNTVRTQIGAGREGYSKMQPTIDEIASIRNSMRLKNIKPVLADPRYPTSPVGVPVSKSLEDNKLNILEYFLGKQREYYSKYNLTSLKLEDLGYSTDNLSTIKRLVTQNVNVSASTRTKSRYNSIVSNSIFDRAKTNTQSLKEKASRGLIYGYSYPEGLGIGEALANLGNSAAGAIMSPMTFKQFNQSYDFFTPFVEIQKAKEAARIANIRREAMASTIRGNVQNSQYVRYMKAAPERARAALAQQQMAARVVDNINISKEIRAIKQGTIANIIKYGKASGPQVNPASLAKSELMIPLRRMQDYVDIQTWRPNAQRKAQGYDVLENTSSLSGNIGKIAKTGERIFKVSQMGAQDSMIGSSDVVKLMFAFYENVLKPGNINAIDPGSTSKYSTNLVQRLKELMPDIKFVDRLTGADWTALSSNNLGFGFGIDPIRSRLVGQDYNEFMKDFLDGRTDLYKKLDDRVQIESIMRQAIKNRSANKFNGGLIPGFANGGAVPGFGSAGFPALLHGGEYVVNSKAVKNIGFAALEAMNNMRFNTPKSPSYAGPVQPQTSSTSNINIYVDNFIGEKQWFESMMKDYNINVSPQNQKTAGLQNRTISTYNGINRGM
jgi:TP901 family phage tail tape measure protein